MPESIEYLSINEIKALLHEIDSTRDQAIVSLFLNTGIFLNELTKLKIDSINWEKKALSIPGNRKREIALNDQAHEALAKWSKDRVDTRASALFVTTKGKVKELSDRSVDHLIRKYAEQAGIKRKVNAQILRNTFAIRLFTEEISIDRASAILGITDSESINRYIKAAKLPVQQIPERIDTRSKPARILSKIFPTKPKIAKPVSELKGPIMPNPEEVVFGREHAIEEIRSNLNKNQPVLLIGPLGIGKTHLLRHIGRILGPNTLYISSPSPIKNMLAQICDKLNPDWRKQIKTRASTRDILDYIIKTKGTKPPLLLIDNLHNLKVSDADSFISLLGNFAILGSTDEIIPRLKQIWWKFKQIELKPLRENAGKELIKYLTQNLSISDYELLETRILSLSNGLPLAIVDMVTQISHQPVVTRERIREIYHEVGIRYRDWTPFLIILWGVAMVFRFIALGTHSFEGYILAGVGIAGLMTTIRFIRMFK
jgi:energy-coupling factor transporter ATP-binding protein EcfA2